MKTVFFILGLSFNIGLCLYPFSEEGQDISLNQSTPTEVKAEIKEDDSFEPLTYSELLRSKASQHFKTH